MRTVNLHDLELGRSFCIADDITLTNIIYGMSGSMKRRVKIEKWVSGFVCKKNRKTTCIALLSTDTSAFYIRDTTKPGFEFRIIEPYRLLNIHTTEVVPVKADAKKYRERPTVIANQ